MTDFTEHERDVLANMLMRSLRGSWGNPRSRTKLLIEIVEEGLSDYDEDAVIARAEPFLDSNGWRDGRKFRYIYEDGPLLKEQTDEATAKSLAVHIPREDMTWDAAAIERRFENDD